MLQNRRLQDIAILMFKVKQKLCPTIICELFHTHCSPCNLRVAEFAIPRFRTKKYSKHSALVRFWHVSEILVDLSLNVFIKKGSNKINECAQLCFHYIFVSHETRLEHLETSTSQAKIDFSNPAPCRYFSFHPAQGGWKFHPNFAGLVSSYSSLPPPDRQIRAFTILIMYTHYAENHNCLMHI